ncbi:DUF4339 domain-containing protein [Phnomibacter ginsenosidimutans]|uniref:DUF4339 domain-containing protein n=1 Tax=Phnomibacter ginsenosidimutans TaxID=2676868 RepID=A0A6I6GPC8_9BACT|nr:DUF4339 domain-containing protein [Phnomibacter ginsenosidimutans]QGW26939.1 DUF4339 domain-containing protein [Phnomibacter ginsenosidimutans]
MAKYFIIKGRKKEGPFDFQELKQIRICEHDLVWRDGFTDWKSANEIEELRDLIEVHPPLTSKEKERVFIINEYRRALYFPFFIGLVFGAIAYFMLITKKPEQLSLNESNYFHATEGSYMQKVTRPFRAVFAYFSEKPMFFGTDENLPVELIKYSIADLILIYLLLFF